MTQALKYDVSFLNDLIEIVDSEMNGNKAVMMAAFAAPDIFEMPALHASGFLFDFLPPKWRYVMSNDSEKYRGRDKEGKNIKRTFRFEVYVSNSPQCLFGTREFGSGIAQHENLENAMIMACLTALKVIKQKADAK